jgi:hypothetical protein
VGCTYEFLDLHDALLGEGRHGDEVDVVLGLEIAEKGLGVLAQVVEGDDVDLVEGHDEGLVGEEGLDGVEELDLVLDGVAALLRDIDDEDDGRPQVRQSRDRKHLDGVPLLEGMIQDTGRIEDL